MGKRLNSLWAAMTIAIVLTTLSGLAVAQSFPSKLVRVINAYPAGGTSDTIARVVADQLAKYWARPVVVENIPGANGFIAAERAAKAETDGHTVLMIDPTIMSMNPALFSKMPYDPVKDFVPVINIAQFSCVLIATPGLGASSVKDVIALARAKPDSIAYGSAGVGSFTHLYQEEFAARAGIKLRHVPYKGNADVVRALLTGEIQLTVSGALAITSMLKEGKIKAIAIASPARLRLIAEIPTFAESGTPFTCASWVGFASQAGTPRTIVNTLAADVSRIIATREFHDKYIVGLGLELLNQLPDEFEALLRAERLNYQGYVKRVNVRLD